VGNSITGYAGERAPGGNPHGFARGWEVSEKMGGGNSKEEKVNSHSIGGGGREKHHRSAAEKIKLTLKSRVSRENQSFWVM